jgi:predicted DCC family thiol-disulfide oxidoreductase YuxK
VYAGSIPTLASNTSWLRAVSMDTPDRIVVFDGLCNLCTGGARWFERHPGKPPFLLVPMQSDRGRELLAKHGYDPDDPLTFLVLDGRQCLTQSDGWIHLIVAAGGGWRLMHAARIIPRAWRDSVYRLIARNRYRWFGRRQVCYLPGKPTESHSPPESSARSGR